MKIRENAEIGLGVSVTVMGGDWLGWVVVSEQRVIGVIKTMLDMMNRKGLFCFLRLINSCLKNSMKSEEKGITLREMGNSLPERVVEGETSSNISKASG